MEHLRVSLFLLLLFCSPCLSEGKTFFTHLGTLCAEDCKPDGGEYKCRSTDEDGKSQSMYCSPQQNVDYWGRQCRADSMCAKYGEDYCWCRINIFSWGFCGLVKEDQTLGDAGEDHHNTSPHRNRRDRKVVEVINDQDIHKTITISVEEAGSDFAASNNKLRKEAADLINHWDNSHLVNQAQSELITSDSFRIDMQGMIKDNNKNKYYHNLQVQMNIKRSKKFPSTTVSQVLVQQGGAPDHYIRAAFLRSMNDQVRVFIDVDDP
ncbi:uncharacterized protein LOC130216220 [Danio aesculapii]|uniref:uncharacterized protein LOC130216220 n=1 Tax=Danio aesculapii TaxID=1142201 RepID=UPI0024BF463C|nr:uncharacterized protein LOC130216220 [Danio aesculapii]